MPAEIDLSLTLPDGRVAARRSYPLDQENRQPSDPARQADEREWLAAELPDAIEQLHVRAGLEQPRSPKLFEALLRDHEDLFAKVRSLIDTFPVPDRDRLAINHTPEQIIDETKGRIESLKGDVDTAGGYLDGIKRALRVDADAVGDDHLVTLIEQLAGSSEHDTMRRLARLATMFGFPQDFDDMDKAVARELERIRTEARAEAARAFIELRDSMAVLYRVPKSDEVNATPVFLTFAAARDAELRESYRRGQLDVLEALDVDASELPADSDLKVWAERAAQTWYAEARQPLESSLAVERSYLANLLRALDVGTERQHDQVRAGEMEINELAQMVGNADDAAAELRETGMEAGRLRSEFGKVLRFFGLPEATPDEKLASRVIKASTAAIEKGIGEVRQDAEQWAEQSGVLRAAFTAAAELFGAIKPMEGDAIRKGADAEALREVTRRVHAFLVARYAEQGVMRSLAQEAAQWAGAPEADRRAVSDGSLSPHDLAGKLREIKATVRKGLGASERDVYRRILDDIAVKLGSKDAPVRDTLLTGAVGDTVRAAEMAEDTLKEVRGVLADLRGGASCTDQELAGLIRQTTLLARFTPGQVATLANRERVLIIDVEAEADTAAPIKARAGNGSVVWVRPADVVDLAVMPPGEFFAMRPSEFTMGDGRRTKAFKLPENGLADILAKVRPPKLPDFDRVDAAADRLADRVETWGGQLADRVNAAADRLAKEIDEAVENAARKRDGGK